MKKGGWVSGKRKKGSYRSERLKRKNVNESTPPCVFLATTLFQGNGGIAPGASRKSRNVLRQGGSKLPRGTPAGRTGPRGPERKKGEQLSWFGGFQKAKKKKTEKKIADDRGGGGF